MIIALPWADAEFGEFVGYQPRLLIESVWREQQKVKYSQLVAHMVILHIA
jgi:hypothetical protein